MAERKRGSGDDRVRGKGKSYVPNADGYVTDVANQLLRDFACATGTCRPRSAPSSGATR